MTWGTLIGTGILGSVFSMMLFAKYCRLLNQRWSLDPETVERYQAWAQRYLAATGGLLVMDVVFIILAAIFQ